MLLADLVGLSGVEEEGQDEDVDSVVLIGVGGGHYAPAVSDLIASSSRIKLGHVVPTYALDFSNDGWASAIREAVTSTRAAYGAHDGEVCVSKASSDETKPLPRFVALVDKKSLKAPERALVVSVLSELGIPSVFSKADVLKQPPS